ncbi:MAG: translation initiation factor IF-2 N-terminal domain-containing protein, partial [Pyrinomonadaceae bacterium]|nr:translation initiation factor IF-2 N-terminal domain-containing protein [Phycisphaerales bacterium]
MAKRISDIAKELGIQSKMIIEKCLAEGIPSDKVKGHMSTVSAGLEASIREWFASGSSVATAVETTEHPDVAKMKAPIRKRAGKPGGKPGEDSPAGVEADQIVDAPAGAAHTVTEEPAHPAVRHPAMARADHAPGDQSKVVEPKSESATLQHTHEAPVHKPSPAAPTPTTIHPTTHSTSPAT